MSGAQLGVYKVCDKIRSRYYKEIKSYVTFCVLCQKRKPDRLIKSGRKNAYVPSYWK